MGAWISHWVQHQQVMEFLNSNDQFPAPSRRKFLLTSLLAVGGLAALKRWWPRSKPKNNKIKLLTHDGKLVEVDVKNMPFNRRVATKKDLVKWVWKNQEL